jgi:hypothetical protein
MMREAKQLALLSEPQLMPTLPQGYQPLRPAHFDVERIVLAKGCISTLERKRFVERICNVYPEVEVQERLDTPHNQLNLGTREPLRLHKTGKHTLVLAELGSAVRFAQESGNACPNYWHFSPRLCLRLQMLLPVWYPRCKFALVKIVNLRVLQIDALPTAATNRSISGSWTR